MPRQTRLRNPNLQIGGDRRLRLPVGKWWSLLYFVVVVFFFAVVYAVLPHWDLGKIVPTFTGSDEKADASFWDCLHFSVITITTIGYGDYRPVGYTRVAAWCEVLTGFVILGMFVSTILSTRQERIAERILKGQINSEIKNFRTRIAELAVELDAVCGTKLNLVFHTYEKGKLLRTAGDARSTESVVYELAALVQGFGRYLRTEARDGEFGDVVSPATMGKIASSLQFALEVLCLYGQNGQKEAKVLERDLVRQVQIISDNATAIGEFIGDEFDVENCANLVMDASLKVRKAFDFKSLRVAAGTVT